MRVATLVASTSRNAGGLFASVRGLSHSLAANGATVDVFSIEDKMTAEDLPAWAPLDVRIFSRLGPARFGFAPGLGAQLMAGEYDTLLTHGLWMYTSYLSGQWARRSGRPCIVNPHGMLDPWAVRQSTWKKRVALMLYEGDNLSRASCVRALCDAEADAIRQFGIKGPVCVIPNGVNLPDDTVKKAEPPWKDAVDRGRRVLLFLSRVHPKKGLLNLLQAWADIGEASRDWALVIAGPDEKRHAIQLQSKTEALGLQHSVTILGPVFGAAKHQAFSNAAAVVLPSLSEGVPVAIQEAWAYRLPVLMTKHCNLSREAGQGAGIETEADPASLAEGLRALFSMSDADRRSMGLIGRRIVEDKFAWSTCGRQMLEVCDWLSNGGPQPDVIRVD